MRITLSIHVIVQIFIRIARLAAAAGAVFASPNPAQVRRAIDLVPSDKGCVSAIYTILVLTANLVNQYRDHRKVCGLPLPSSIT